jgi:hypothetical protein
MLQAVGQVKKEEGGRVGTTNNTAQFHRRHRGQQRRQGENGGAGRDAPEALFKSITSRAFNYPALLLHGALTSLTLVPPINLAPIFHS